MKEIKIKLLSKILNQTILNHNIYIAQVDKLPY